MGKDLFQQLYFENLLPDKEPLPELREYVSKQYGIFTALRDSFGLFLKALNRSIRVTLKDDYIEIENSSSFHYYKRKDRSYIHQFLPWLRQGTETDTYQFSHVKYNHDDKKNGMRYVHHGEHKPTDNPFYFHGIIGLSIPLKKDEENHVISYISKYHVDYAQFFHSYSFPFFCQTFHITVQMFDERKSKKDGKYMLRWEMATPYSMDYAYNSKRMVQQKEDIIEFDSLSWMTPSSSYVVTVNYIKNT